MKRREVARKPITLRCEELPRKGGESHRKWFNPQTQRLAVVPDWGGKDLKAGTVQAAVRQLGLDWHDFLDA